MSHHGSTGWQFGTACFAASFIVLGLFAGSVFYLDAVFENHPTMQFLVIVALLGGYAFAWVKLVDWINALLGGHKERWF